MTLILSAIGTTCRALPQKALALSSSPAPTAALVKSTSYFSILSSSSIRRSYASSINNNTNDNSNSINLNSNQRTASTATQKKQYVSPFQEIFNSIEEGKTFLGTKEFQYPTVKYLKCGIPEHKLKFKTTTYGRLLEEPHVRPNEHRVIVQVAVRHIPFPSDIERHVFREIVGNRLNDETGILQLSSSQFGSRIENKRHVVSMLERSVESAKALAARVVSGGEEYKNKGAEGTVA